MRVLTWNTYLAPFMPDRKERLPRVLRTITGMVEDGADVLALQELHGYMRGPIGTWLRHWNVPTWVRRWLGDAPAHALQIIGEFLAILEGWAWPSSYHAPYRHAVVRHCVAQGLAYATPIATRATGRLELGDHGVLLVSRWPLHDIVAHDMPQDTIHRPGMVCATVRGHRLWAVHLLPRLPAGAPHVTYRIVHALNRLAGVRGAQLARANLQQLRQWLDAEENEKEDNDLVQVLLGDFNANVDTVQAALPRAVLCSPNINTLCTHDIEAPSCLDQVWLYGDKAQEQRASVLSSSVERYDGNVSLPLHHTIGSDHYPVRVLLDLSQ